MGLVLYTKVDFSDSGDLGNKVNIGLVMVHFDISSKLMRPWYLAPHLPKSQPPSSE